MKRHMPSRESLIDRERSWPQKDYELGLKGLEREPARPAPSTSSPIITRIEPRRARKTGPTWNPTKQILPFFRQYFLHKPNMPLLFGPYERGNERDRAREKINNEKILSGKSGKW